MCRFSGTVYFVRRPPVLLRLDHFLVEAMRCHETLYLYPQDQRSLLSQKKEKQRSEQQLQ
jgi:hypothetical protein